MDLNQIVEQVGKLFGLVNKLPWPWNVLAWIVLAGGLIVYLLTQTIDSIPEDQRALRTRFDAVKEPDKEHPPGLVFGVPGMHRYEKISVRDKTVDLDAIRVKFGPFKVLHARATVIFKVEKIYRVRYRADDLDRQLRAASEDALRRTILLLGDESAHDSERVQRQVAAYMLETTRHLGVKVLYVKIQEILPDPAFTQSAAIAGIGDANKVIELLEHVDPPVNPPAPDLEP